MKDDHTLDPTIKQYLEYIDKEMLIAGILSTFSVAAASLVIEQIVTAQSGTYLAQLCLSSKLFFWIAIAMMIFSAGFFYWQRARLAYDYGQISLSLSIPNDTGKTTEEWMKKVDSWPTWIPHDWGIIFLISAFVEDALGIISHEFSFNKSYTNFSLLTPVVLCIVITVVWALYMVKRE